MATRCQSPHQNDRIKPAWPNILFMAHATAFFMAHATASSAQPGGIGLALIGRRG